MTDLDQLVTESRNERTKQLDQKSTEEILTIINEEDQTVALQVQKAIPEIIAVVEKIVASFKRGGRLFYVGAGTSGRIGTLDASECPPTFSTDPQMVRGLIAGGQEAVFRSVEGAEDDEGMGITDMAQNQVTASDIVIGITANGGAPYVIGALKEARKRGAATVAFACNRKAVINDYADMHITVEVGPEVVTGSTRMKAGTAQKLVLNMLTTTAMIKLGKVYDNLMVDMQPLNAKLTERAKRIIQTAADCTREEAEELFSRSGGHPKVAIVMHRCGVNRERALELLAQTDGFVQRAIEQGF
ncbi:N-acetylmuramic acid 6-phosphate etherase [Brevibacillus fluminis]|uniref:N-acetylmuramic acid 6-phosphate etherase n=1 Tax=Brevibacillus fluminis TaxID=511487 RepID=A0A3M8DFY1_9BACL|nr:N-acetylmuramic acid 6-phosphate etherase [Brevibacillus fluminis]RNB86993.1 N-acetylmuramic acid 6-phosphate etherase [Brevibacillus fluminis]